MRLFIKLFSLFLISFNLAPQLAFTTESQNHHPENIQKLQVLTFNLWDVGKAVGEYNNQRIRAVCRLFKETYENNGWDIILIQELWPLRKRKDTLKDCGYPYALNLDREYSEVTNPWPYQWIAEQAFEDRIDTGLRILSRYPISAPKRHTYSENGSEGRLLDTMSGFFTGRIHLDFEVIDLGKVGFTQDAEYIASKSAILVTVEHPEIGPILVVNTHLISNFKDENYHEQRWLQLEEFSKFVKKHTKKIHVATIVGGDFNIGPLQEGNEHSEHYRNPDYDWDYMMSKLFFDFYYATPLGKCTYCFSSNRFATAEGGVDQPIDHILASPNLIVEDAAIVDEKVRINKYMRVPLSDHYGVEAQFKIAPLPWTRYLLFFTNRPVPTKEDELTH